MTNSKYEWPNVSEINQLVDQHGKAGAARVLDIPASTFKDHLNRLELGEDGLSDSPSEDFVEIPVFFRDYSHLKKLHLYPLGDAHLGSPAHAEDRWVEWLKFLQDAPYAALLGTGDFLDSALKDSKSESYDQVMNVGRAKRKLRNQLKALADEKRIDLLMPGNHEARIYRSIGDCPIEDICDSLEVNYARAAALLVYHVGDISYEIYIRHGTGSGGTTIGARANQLQRQAHVALADVYVSGHTHSQLVSADSVFVRNGDRVERKRRLYVSSGSFVNYETYASERGYVPGKIGAPRIYLDGTRKDVHVSI